MALKKVFVEMDEGWNWWIPGENGPLCWNSDTKRKTTVKVNEEWLEELKRVSNRYREMQRVLEHLYRKQEELKPFQTSSIEDSEELQRATLE